MLEIISLQSVGIVMEGLDENRDYVNLFTFDNETREVLIVNNNSSEEAFLMNEVYDKKAFLCTNETKDDLYFALEALPQPPPSVPSNITKAIETAILAEEQVRYTSSDSN